MNRPMVVNMSNPTYMGSADSDRSRADSDRSRAEYSDYFPGVAGQLAEDAAIEGSLRGGAAQGPAAVRTIVGAICRVLPRQRVLNERTRTAASREQRQT
jgi:hypothetical protein